MQARRRPHGGEARHGARTRTSSRCPVDSTVLIRNRSTLGLKYLEITPGDSDGGLRGRGDDPDRPRRARTRSSSTRCSTPSTSRTRIAAEQNLKGFGDALAGRGPRPQRGDRRARAAAPPRRSPSSRNLASAQTNLGGFFRGLAAVASEVAPVAETAGAAVRRPRPDLRRASPRSRGRTSRTRSRAAPATLAEGDPVAARSCARSSSTRASSSTPSSPGAKALGDTSPAIAAALHAGIPVLNESPKFNRELEPTAQALLDFQAAPGRPHRAQPADRHQPDPRSDAALPRPGADDLQLPLAAVPELRQHGSQGDGLGTWTRFIAFTPPRGPERRGLARRRPPRTGPSLFNHLHYNPYPNTASPGQPRECEAGNEIYEAGKTVIGNPPGDQGIRTAEPDQGPARAEGRSEPARGRARPLPRRPPPAAPAPARAR